MFESILEKVLLKAAGDYIDGLDAKNLKVGIWGGDVVIENVSLKEGIIEMLDLPVTLRFSHIGKLTLKVPWKNLSSAPVEVYLDGVYLIISPKHSSEWTFKDYKGLKQKIDNIQEYANECLKKFQETHKKQAEGDKDAGYVEKLTMKIIDNLQVSIKSIHVRYEDTLSKTSSWGITLDQLDIFTTDAYDKRIYIDRTKEENKEEPMRKSLQLSNLGIYWNAHEENMLAHESKDKKLDVMEGMIKRGNNPETRVPCKYLLGISCAIKFQQNKSGQAEIKPDIPEIQLDINLDRIDFTLEQTQLQQIIRMAEYFTTYQKKLGEQKKANKSLTDGQIRKYQKRYCELYKRIQETETKDPAILGEGEKDEFENIVLSLEYEDLYECTKKVMIEISKEKKIEDLEQKKKKEKQGFFGGWFGGGKKEEEEDLVTQDDLANIDQFFEDNFAGEGLTVTNYKRPMTYIWFVLNFTLQGSVIKLNRENPVTKEIEGISFDMNMLTGSLNMRDDNLEFVANLKDMHLDNVTHQPMLKQTQSQNFLRPNQTVQQDNLIHVKFEQKPMDARHIDSKVLVDIKSARIEYNPVFVQRIVMFFDVKVENEDLKNATFEAVEELQEKAEENRKERMQSKSVLWLDVHLASPIIVLPFKNDGSLRNEAWILNLGDLTMKSNPRMLAENVLPEDKGKDIFDVNLTNIKMQYFPTLEFYNQREMDPNYEWNYQEGQIENYKIINDFNISVRIMMLKEVPNQNTAKMQIEGELPQLKMDLNQEMYKRILKIGEIFAVPDEISKERQASMSLEAVQTEKKALVQKAQKVGILYQRGQTVHTWHKKTAVLSGRYLYIFASPRDQQPESHYWVNNSEITPVSEANYGYANAFRVKNKYTEIYLACDKADHSEKWQTEIGKIKTGGVVHKLDDKSDLASDMGKSNVTASAKKDDKIDLLQKNMSIKFMIKDVQLSLFDPGCTEDFLVFETKSIGLLFDQYAQSFDCQLSLGGMYLRDKIYKHMDPKLENFITSEEFQGEKVDLIQIGVAQKSNEHPHYKGVQMDIQCKLGNLIVNFKPDTLLKVLKFIQVEQESAQVENVLLEGTEGQQPGAQDDNQSMKDDGKSQLDASTNVQKQVTNDVLMQATVELKKIQLVLVNRRTHLAMGSLSIENIGIQFKKLQDEMVLDGTLGNLQILDLTNYPKTIFREEDYDKVKPVEILGLLKTENQSQSLLKIYFRAIDEGSAKVGADNVRTFLDVKLSQIHINFMMQPVMRLLDYSLVQALGPLQTPELFEDQNNMHLSKLQKEKLEKKQQEIKDPMAPLRALGRAEVKKNLLNPAGMKMHVVIEKPLIQLKPNPYETKFLQITLGNITITNERVLNDERIVENDEAATGLKATYSEQFNICLQDMSLGFVKDGKEIEMSKLFHFNIKMDMPGFVNEYWYVYKDKLKIDKTMKMRCYLSPIIIRMTNADYCLVMRCLFHNITYDDGCDRFMIHEYLRNLKIQKENEKNQENRLARLQKFRMKSPEDQNKSSFLQHYQDQFDGPPPDEGGSIDFQLDMENLSFFAGEGEKSIPFARVTLNDLRIQFLKEPSGDIQTNLYGLELDGSCFKKDDARGVYQESGLLRKIDTDNQYSEEQMLEVTNLLKDVNEESVQGEQFVGYEFPSFPGTVNKIAFEEKKLQFVMELKMTPTGDKNMRILIQDFKVMAETGPLLKLAGFANMDETVEAPPPFYVHNGPDDFVGDGKKQLSLIKEEEEDDFQAGGGNKPFFDLEEENRKKEEEEKQQQEEAQQGKMEIEVNLRNVIICALVPNSNQTLAIKGEFDVGILFQPRQMDAKDVALYRDELKAEFERQYQEQEQEIPEKKQLEAPKKSKKDKNLNEEEEKKDGEDEVSSKEQQYRVFEISKMKQLNEVSKFDVNIQTLEIFLCNKTDLMTKQFQKVKKREILHPLNIKLLMKTLNPPSQPDFTQFYNRTIIDVDIEQLILVISSRDVLLLKDSFDYLMADLNSGKTEEQLQKEKEEKEKLEKEKKDKEMEGYDDTLKMTAEQKQQLQEIAQDASLYTEQVIKCKVGGLQIIVINDIGSIFTPVLDFNILSMEVLMNQNSLQTKISIIPFVFKAKYYNPRVGSWEPIIDEIGFNIDYIDNTIGNIKQHICVEINDAYTCMSFNISTQFIAIVLQFMTLIQQNTKKLELEDQSGDSSNSKRIERSQSNTSSFTEDVDSKVSPYTIKNETGYPIEVELEKQDDGEQLMTQIKNNASVNFDVVGNIDTASILQNKNKVDKEMTNIASSNIQHKVSVKLLNKNLNVNMLKHISLDRMRSQNSSFSKQFRANTQVKLDLKTNRKILYVSSPVIFQNNTNLACLLKFGKAEKNIIQGNAVKLKQGETAPVPIDCIGLQYQIVMVDKSGKEHYGCIRDCKELELTKQDLLDEKNLKNIELLVETNKYLKLRRVLDKSNYHKTLVSVEAPFKFKNCLPKPVLLQILSSQKKTTSIKELVTDQTYEEYDHSSEKKIYLKINLPGFFWSREVTLQADRELESIPILDHSSNYSGIEVKKFQELQGTIQYYLYCTAYLVNESPYDLIMHTKKSKTDPIMVGGQYEVEPEDDIEKNLVIFGKNSGEILTMTDKQLPTKFSKQTSITTPGNTEVEASIWLHNREQLISMGVDVQLTQSNAQPRLMTKKITVSPRYILVNKTSKIILARQEGETGTRYASLPVDGRQPVYWSNSESAKEVNLCLYDANNEDISMIQPEDSRWDWSKNININNIGTQNFCLQSRNNPKELHYMKTDIREGGSNIFIVIEEVKEDSLPYKIVNSSNLITAEIQNVGFENTVLKKGDSSNFGWVNPSDKKELTVKLIPTNGNYEEKEINFCPDIINHKEKFKIECHKNLNKKDHPYKYVKSHITIEGFTKIVTFYDSLKSEKLVTKKERDEDADKDMKSEIQHLDEDIEQRSVTSRQSSLELFNILQQINISFKGIGISVIMNHEDQHKTKELLYIKFINLELIMLTKQKSKITQLRLQYMQIDNNSEHIVQYPVIFTPTHHKAHTHPENPKQFINIYIEQNLHTDQITLYDNVIIDMAPFTVKIEEKFLNSVFEFLEAYNQIDAQIRSEENLLEKKQEQRELHQHLRRKEFIWMTTEIPPESAPTFIDQIILTNIQINLTFQAKGRTGSKDSALPLFETIFSAVGIALANIDDAPIKLNGIQLKACFDSTSGIVGKLFKHYKSQAITEGLKIVGSLNIIGNPVGLFSNISSGVQDLIEKPMEGLVQGPLETGMGIMKGSASLLTKTISGAFNSVSKITGSVSTGIAALTMDEDYMQEREKMRAKKPKHIVDGVGQGIVSIFGGIGKGITGVFLKPFEGAKKDGVKGFFKGTVMGITGLVTKPITGAIDAVAKTAEGIKNTVNFMDDKPTEQRERAPRVFYGYDRQYKEYYDLDGEMLTVLQLYKKGIYAQEYFFAAFKFKVNEKNSHDHVLILLLEHIILLSEKTSKREWIVANNEIRNIKYTQEGIQIALEKENKYTKSRSILLGCTDKNVQQHVCGQLEELQIIYQEEKKYIAKQKSV